VRGKRSKYERPGRGRPRNLAQIGARLGITHQAVAQLLQDAPVNFVGGLG
jgi:hypothetical protein